MKLSPEITAIENSSFENTKRIPWMLNTFVANVVRAHFYSGPFSKKVAHKSGGSLLPRDILTRCEHSAQSQMMLGAASIPPLCRALLLCSSLLNLQGRILGIHTPSAGLLVKWLNFSLIS